MQARAGSCDDFDPSIDGKVGDLCELVGDGTITAAAGHFVQAAPLAMISEPVLKNTGHHEPHKRRFESAAFALGGVVTVLPLEFAVECDGHLRADRGGYRSGFQLDPPFMAAPNQAGERAREQRGGVKIYERP